VVFVPHHIDEAVYLADRLADRAGRQGDRGGGPRRQGLRRHRHARVVLVRAPRSGEAVARCGPGVVDLIGHWHRQALGAVRRTHGRRADGDLTGARVGERRAIRGLGNLARSPFAWTWKSVSTSGRPGRRCRPRLRKRTPVGADGPTAVLVSRETTICSPWAAEHTRAVVCTASPMYPTSVSVGRPL